MNGSVTTQRPSGIFNLSRKLRLRDRALRVILEIEDIDYSEYFQQRIEALVEILKEKMDEDEDITFQEAIQNSLKQIT